MPGRDRSDLRTAEEASAGQWVIVPAFSIRVALRRGNRAPLPRPAVPASPENNYQCRSRPLNRSLRALGAVVSIDFAQATQDVDVATASLRAT